MIVTVSPSILPLLLAHREEIQQSLRGVFVHTVACVDHRRAERVSEALGDTRHPVSNHHRVQGHGVQVVRGIAEGSALDRLDDAL